MPLTRFEAIVDDCLRMIVIEVVRDGVSGESAGRALENPREYYRLGG